MWGNRENRNWSLFTAAGLLVCLTPYVRSECCFDKDVAFDGGSILSKFFNGDNYWRPFYDRICQNYQVCLASDHSYGNRPCEDYNLEKWRKMVYRIAKELVKL